MSGVGPLLCLLQSEGPFSPLWSNDECTRSAVSEVAAEQCGLFMVCPKTLLVLQ
jgi:hypothetical protein